MSDPVAIVRAYLAAMQARDLDQAKSMLGKGFRMVFPGTGAMTTLEQLVEWAGPRYRSVAKAYDGFDAVPDDGHGRAVVYCFGTLAGQWPDGTGFDGIRFIDRFELTDGRITRQDVWNDLAEVKARE